MAKLEYHYKVHFLLNQQLLLIIFLNIKSINIAGFVQKNNDNGEVDMMIYILLDREWSRFI